MSERPVAETVPDLDALIYCIERCGFKVVPGEYTRLDGRQARIGLRPVDARALLVCAMDALDDAQYDGPAA